MNHKYRGNAQKLGNMVCGVIPEGYILALCMERGSAWVELRTYTGERIPIPDTHEFEGLGEEVYAAIEVAKRHKKESGS